MADMNGNFISFAMHKAALVTFITIATDLHGKRHSDKLKANNVVMVDSHNACAWSIHVLYILVH